MFISFRNMGRSETQLKNFRDGQCTLAANTVAHKVEKF